MLRPFAITFRPSKGRHARTWTRFYASQGEAEADAQALIERETCGRGRVLFVAALDADADAEPC